MTIDKKLQGKSGIYQILVKTKKKEYLYIGSSVNLYYRLHSHMSHLRLLRHDNIILQQLYNKHGKDAFSYTILEMDIERNSLREREQFYIDLKNPKINIIKEVTRIEINEETKRKISNNLKKQWEEGTIKHSGTPMKPVSCFDLQGKFIRNFRSLQEAGNFIGEKDAAKISDCCNKKRKSVRGFQFVFEGEEFITVPIDIQNRTRSKMYDIILKEENSDVNIPIKGGAHGLYLYFTRNLYQNPQARYSVSLAPVKLGELLEYPKAINTTTELEKVNVNVEKLIDIYDGQSAAKSLKAKKV